MLVAILLLLVIVTAIVPPDTIGHSTLWDLGNVSWSLSDDGSVAVALSDDGTSRVWRVESSWPDALKPEIRFEYMLVSPRGDWVTGSTEAGEIYVWRPDTILRATARPALHINLGDDHGDPRWRFSPDAKWLCASDQEGRTYL